MKTIAFIAVLLFASVASAQYVVPNQAYGNFGGGYSYVYPQMVYPTYPVYPAYRGGYYAPGGYSDGYDLLPYNGSGYRSYSYRDSNGRYRTGTIYVH